MPFGLSGAAPNFQKAIDIILKLVIGRFVMVYVDDVIIASPSFNEHIDHLNQFSSDKNSKYLINMPRFCNKTFKRRKFGANYKDSSASEDLNKELPANTKVYEVNTRLAYAMRSVGKGEAAAKVFCGVMNLPPPPKRFYESLHALNNATEKVAKVSMALAAAETLSFNNGNPNVPVAIDGTWQKRGHTSLNGVVTAWGMEVEGALRIFNRSEVLHNLRYTQYLGDGDSKAYKAVLESKLYKDVNIEKLECVGHVEKRMGTRLRALKLKLKGKKLEDKKSLGGRNRLTDAEIDKLQRYYGLITKLKVLDLLNIQPGFYTCRALQEADHARIRKAEKAISRRTKEARIKNRQLKCRQEDDLADDLSNPSYGSALNSREQLIREQRKDPELGHIYRYLENPDNGSVNASVCEGRKIITPFRKLINVADGAEYMGGNIENLFEEARQNMRKQHKTWERYYNRKRKQGNIIVNDLVLVQTHFVSAEVGEWSESLCLSLKGDAECWKLGNNNVTIWKKGHS
ncbi:uncharacterized protein TNCV_2413831 [Trichonephila clavipes]|nr:uncharacterized protein TNCV_2413831 [Trichonephila clavipes]